MRRPPESLQALTPFPTVEARVHESTELWARDLRSLFEHARDRFADVSWETDSGDRVWAHKAVVYVRAPKAFKDRYFLTNKTISRSPTSFSAQAPTPSPYPVGSSLLPPGYARRTPSPSLFRESTASIDTAESDGTLRAPTLGAGDGVLRLGHDDAPELFRAQLEWLYTGEGFGDVVEWISEEAGGSNANVRDSLGRRGDLADRRDKLGQDLTYMWTSKLYCDVRIHLETPDGEGYNSDTSEGSDDSLSSTVIFTAHRFMLASRSPYFSTVLLNPSQFRPVTADIHLPTPPFTPAALHFCLGWIYAGHLDFSNRSFDLLTAFQIYRAASYLQLEALADELESRLVHDFCHGLEWSRCHCRKCIGRVSRIWRFTTGGDVGALELHRRCRRFILSGWAECWGREVGLADKGERDDLVTDVISTLGPSNVVTSFRGIERVRARMEHGIRTKGADAAIWVDALGDMIEVVEKRAREVLATQFAAVCESKELWDVMAGKGFSEDVLDHVLREIVDIAGRPPIFIESPKMYQTVVSSILLKVHPDTLETALPPRGLSRQKIEQAKEGILVHIRRRWMQIKEDGGFLGLEPWSLKEISDEIEVPVDDLLSARHVTFPRSRDKGFPRTSSRATGLSEADSSRTRTASDASHTSTLRSAPVQTPEPPEPNGLRRLRLSSSASTSSAVSVRTAASRTASTQRRTTPTTGPQARSPTAAHKTFVVSVGKSRGTPGPSGTMSPTPPRPGQVMTGPPRPLLTGKSVGSRVKERIESPASPSPPASRPGTRTGSRPQSPTRGLRHQISMASVSSVATSRTSATVRSTTSTRTATGLTGPTKASSSSTAAGKAPVGKAPARPATAAATTRPATVTRPTTTPATRTARPTVTAANGTPKASSSSATTSTGTPKASGSSTTTSTARTPISAAATANGKAPVRAALATKPVSAATAAVRQRTMSAVSTSSVVKPVAPRTRTMSASSSKSRAPTVAPGAVPDVPPVPKTTTTTKQPVVTPSASRTSLASKASIAAARATTARPSDPKTAAAAKTPTLRPSASTKSLGARSTVSVKTTKTAVSTTPKTPTVSKAPTKPPARTPSTPSDTLQTPSTGSSTRVRATSLNPKETPPSIARQRTASSSAPWKRATPLPPTVAGVKPRGSIRSSSGSTEGPPEAITPRLSVVEPIIVLDDSATNSPVLAESPNEKSRRSSDSDIPPVPPLPSVVVEEVKVVDEPTVKLEEVGNGQAEVVSPISVVISPTPEDEAVPTTPTIIEPVAPVEPPVVQQPVVLPATVEQPAPIVKAPTVGPVKALELAAVKAPEPAVKPRTTAATVKPEPTAKVPTVVEPEAPAKVPTVPPPTVVEPPPTPAKVAPAVPTMAALPKATMSAANPPPTPPKNPRRSFAPPATPPKMEQPLPRAAKAPPPSFPSTSPVPTIASVEDSPRSGFAGTMSRKVSETGSVRSVRYHPAHAFDPPPRKPSVSAAPPAPPKLEVEDGNVPFKGSGVTLHVGIPCIVTLSTRRARFRANVKYLGTMANARGPWVGLEVDDLDRFGVETLPTGAKSGVRYFHFSPPDAPAGDEARSIRQRRISAIADSLSGRGVRRPNGLGLAVNGNNSLGPPADTRRAASPFVADWTAPEKPRALFVRPSEVLFVMGAE